MQDDIVLAGDVPDRSPAERIEAVFRRIHEERMAGLPFLNPALCVETADFIRYGACWLGVLITPWSMSFMAYPNDTGAWRDLEDGARRRWRLPSGEYEFIVGVEPDLGRYQTCVLMSPVTRIADQDAARAMARAVMQRLLLPTDAESRQAGSSAAPGWYGPEKAVTAEQGRLSRRAFLRLDPRALRGTRG